MAGLKDRIDRSIASIETRVPGFGDGGFIGIVLGSGVGGLADAVQDAIAVPYSTIEGFANTSVVGHRGRLVCGTLGGCKVAVMQGRVHLYEGHSMPDVVHGVRVLASAGARAVVLTNAAGGLDTSFDVGDLMVIDDHLNFTGQNPLAGMDSLELGPRFPDVTHAWAPALRDALLAAGTEVGVPIRRGVYVGMLGPSYETPAEVRMLQIVGGHAVGMSTVPEALSLAQLGCPVAGVSVISNAAAGTEGAGILDHAHVAEVAVQASSRMTALLTCFLTNREQWWNSPNGALE